MAPPVIIWAPVAQEMLPWAGLTGVVNAVPSDQETWLAVTARQVKRLIPPPRGSTARTATPTSPSGDRGQRRPGARLPLEDEHLEKGGPQGDGGHEDGGDAGGDI